MIKSISPIFHATEEEAKGIILEYVHENMIPRAEEYLTRMINQAFRGGKHLRGIMAAASYMELMGIQPTVPKARIGCLIGWANEVMESAFLVADDLMDRSTTRRGQKCWYLNEDVGDFAVNDSLLFENFAFTILEKIRGEFTEEQFYRLRIFVRRVLAETAHGQTHDFLAKEPTFEIYRNIVTTKTSYYTILLPFISASIASGKLTTEQNQGMVHVLLDIGYIFQAQDDFIDVFGDPSITGKVGTDLADRKITWIVCQLRESLKDRKEEWNRFLEVWGKHEPDQIAAAKQIIKDAGVEEKFKEFLAQEKERISSEISDLAPCYPKQSINEILQVIYDRKY